MLNRRQFLQIAGAALAAALTSTRTAFATVQAETRLVVIILRGGLDGLHAMPPYADKNYQRLRPTMAIAAPGRGKGALDLDGYFGLHSALAPLHQLYSAKELLMVPAASTRYRQRSHFDGQNMLENGSGKPYGARDGWLNRAILGMNGGNRKMGLAFGPAVPLILQGDARVQTWARSQLPKADEGFLMRLGRVYESDALFAAALADAKSAIEPKLGMADMQGRPRRDENFSLAAKAAADLLARDDGPRIAVMELQGWDTHFGQDRRLRDMFTQLSRGILDLKQGLGAAWSKAAVMAVSEFGRTAAENGSLGTDHGTGGLAILAGGAVAGGRIAGEWPGLSTRALYEGRDLRSVNDYESIFKAALINHMGLGQAYIEDTVFPASVAWQPMEGLFRNS